MLVLYILTHHAWLNRYRWRWADILILYRSMQHCNTQNICRRFWFCRFDLRSSNASNVLRPLATVCAVPAPRRKFRAHKIYTWIEKLDIRDETPEKFIFYEFLYVWVIHFDIHWLFPDWLFPNSYQDVNGVRWRVMKAPFLPAVKTTLYIYFDCTSTLMKYE